MTPLPPLLQAVISMVSSNPIMDKKDMLVIVSNEMVRSNEAKCAYLSSRIAAIEDRQEIARRRSERSS
jgi:hypothetical protein